MLRNIARRPPTSQMNQMTVDHAVTLDTASDSDFPATRKIHRAMALGNMTNVVTIQNQKPEGSLAPLIRRWRRYRMKYPAESHPAIERFSSCSVIGWSLLPYMADYFVIRREGLDSTSLTIASTASMPGVPALRWAS